jgi:hypothetical protein
MFIWGPFLSQYLCPFLGSNGQNITEVIKICMKPILQKKTLVKHNYTLLASRYFLNARHQVSEYQYFEKLTKPPCFVNVIW